ncbi:MAG: UDP-N-acetylmuramate dehydrogenase [Pseudomonadota bacterium]
MSGGSLAAANTLGVPSRADRLVPVHDASTLRRLVDEARAQGIPWTVLGGGSNVVLRRRVPGLVCLMRNRGIAVASGPDGGARVTAAAGERWHDLVRFTLGQGLVGLENLALIPGSVGAAPIQNVGAYGVELADRFVSLRALDTASGEVVCLDRTACRFGYRDSLFKSAEGARFVVLSVTLALARAGAPVLDYAELAAEVGRLGRWRPTAAEVADAVIRVRRRKLPDPRRHPNVGSFFKNPEVAAAQAQAACRRHPGLTTRPAPGGRVKLSAAQLIDACGWKGRSSGSVSVWHRQPLVLVNHGGAAGADVLAMSEDIRHDVDRRFGIRLELEPRVLGQD